MTELAEGARLEIVCAPKAYLGFESLSLRQMNIAFRRVIIGCSHPKVLETVPGRRSTLSTICRSLDRSTLKTEEACPKRRGGRVVECGGLENRFTGAPGDEGSNPSSSASLVATLVNSH